MGGYECGCGVSKEPSIFLSSFAGSIKAPLHSKSIVGLLPADRSHKSGKTIICGHMPERSGRIKGRWICSLYDTGPAIGGWLTCLNAESGEYWHPRAGRSVLQQARQDIPVANKRISGSGRVVMNLVVDSRNRSPWSQQLDGRVIFNEIPQ